MVLGLKSIALGLMLGVSLAAPPGPMNALIAEQSIRRGWEAGFRAGLGAMFADAVFCVLAFAGATTLVRENPGFRSATLMVGGALMLYFAYAAASSRGFSCPPDPPAPDGESGFLKAFLLALSNPYQIGWWVTAGVGLIHPGSIELLGTSFSRSGGVVLLLGFFGGIGLWIVLFPAALVGGTRRFRWLGRLIVYGSAVLLAGFGGVFLHEGLSALLPLF